MVSEISNQFSLFILHTISLGQADNRYYMNLGFEHFDQYFDESMVSLVLRQYMRGENVLLIQIGKQNVKIIEK